MCSSDLVEQAMSSTNLEISIINQTLENGVSKIVTETGYVFDKEGLNISKTGEEMDNTITNEGVYVKKDSTEILGADTSGVRAENVTVRKYLTVGNHSRLENYGNSRTGCFYLD